MAELDLPERLNAAAVLVDSHLAAGRAGKAAILCGERTVTYGQLHENVNRLGNALLTLGTRMEERIAILLPDSPEWVYAFFAAMKIGAVAVPMNTMLKSKDYEYLLATAGRGSWSSIRSCISKSNRSAGNSST